MACVAVVNNDTDFLDLMADVLDLEGHQTIIIKESRTAYQRLKDVQPNLIILDIRMDSPEDGWNICELLKLDPITQAIPIIICSASIGELQEKAPWLAQHGIGTLPKPFDIDDLYESVRVTLETGRAVIRGLDPL